MVMTTRRYTRCVVNELPERGRHRQTPLSILLYLKGMKKV